MLKYPIVQIAYFVTDAEQAAYKAAAQYGAGPFFLVRNIELAWGECRGQPQAFVHTSAYGQWGSLMLELVQQDVEGPSPFRDMYAPGEQGLHHMAMMVDSLSNAYADTATQGYQIAAKAETLTGTEFAFVDTVAELDHMLEIYEKSEALTGFYARVREAAERWDGTQVVQVLS